MGNCKELEASSLLTKDDYIKASKVAIKMKIREKRIYLLVPLIWVFMVALGVCIGLTVNGVENQILTESLPTTSLYKTVIFIIFSIALFVAMIIYQKNAPKKHYDSDKALKNKRFSNSIMTVLNAPV